MVLQKKLTPYLLIALLSCTVYLQNMWFDYATLDDNLVVFEEFDKISSLAKIPAAFAGGYLYDNYYRPMIMISFIIDTAIAGQSSAMYHLTNLILHLMVSLLVYLFLKRITKEDLLSLLFALWFSIHPLNVNAVSWIAGRNDLLAALFSLLSVLSFIKYREGNGRKYLYLFSVCYILAMLSKEIGVLIPVILFFYILLLKPPASFTVDFVKLKTGGLKLIREFIPLLTASVVPALIYFLLRLFLSPVKVREEMSVISFFQNTNIPFEYIAKIFYFFEFVPLSMTNITLVILGGLFSLILLIAVIVNKKTDYKKFFFGLVFFLLFVLPSMFVRVPASDGGFNYIDCRVYLPLTGFFIMLISIIPKGLLKFQIKSTRLAAAVTLAVVFLYSLTFSAIENQYYKNGKVFWSRLIEIYPERATYWMGLGFYYFDNKDFINAAACAERAVYLKPEMSEFYSKGALAYMNAGDNANAIRLLEGGLNLETDKSYTYLYLVKNYLAIGNISEAEKYSEKLLKYKTFDKLTDNITDDSGDKVLQSRRKAGLLYSASYYFYDANLYDISLTILNEAISLHPSESVYHNLLGVILFKCGMKDSAIRCFLKALDLDPSNKEAYSNLVKLQPN
jgi:lipoprotein NlpI